MKKFELLKFPRISDQKGTLVPFEFSDIPFEVKRVYLVTGKENIPRGQHAHIIEDELFVAVSGSILVKVNDGTGDTEILLDSPNVGLLVRKDCWHELHNFAENTIVMAFSSTEYLPGAGNYITDKEKFLKNCQK
jgi:dTDP-4-dehydrorhamnose 3,5-epimerase